MNNSVEKLAQEKEGKEKTSSFRMAASAFAFCRFSHAAILASSLLALQTELVEKLADKVEIHFFTYNFDNVIC